MSLLHSISDTGIEDKEKLEEEFLSFLHDLDYPQDSIFRGPSFQLKLEGKWRDIFYRSFGKTIGSFPCYADLAILELETCQYAGLVEFRLQLDEQIESRLATVFQAVLDGTQSRPPAFLVVPGINAGFRIYQLRENAHWQELPKKHFPHYHTLIAGLTAEKTLVHGIVQARSLSRFTLTCRILAAAIGLITLASILGLSALNTGQMSLLILAVFLLVVPDAIGFHLFTPKPKTKLLNIIKP